MTMTNTKFIIAALTNNYQHLIYINKIPVLEKEGQIEHFIPIPIPQGQNFIGVLPEHDYLITCRNT